MHVLMLTLGEYSDSYTFPIATSESKQALSDFAKEYEGKRLYKHKVSEEYSKRYRELLEANPHELELPERPRPQKPPRTAAEQKAWVKVKKAWEDDCKAIMDAQLDYEMRLREQAAKEVLKKHPDVEINPHSYFGGGYFEEGDYEIKQVNHLETGSE